MKTLFPPNRIYINTPHEHIVTNVVSGRKMRVQKWVFKQTHLNFPCSSDLRAAKKYYFKGWHWSKLILGLNMFDQADHFDKLMSTLSHPGTTCRTLSSGILGTARPRKWRTLETTRSFNFVLQRDSYNAEIFFWNQNFQFPNMICVNAGQVSTPVTLLAGQAFEASLILQVM